MTYRMPAEWAFHDRCWMAWPCREIVWTDIEATRRAYAAVAHAIRRFEPVCMLVPPAQEAGARNLLGADIELLVAPIDDSWARDSGPCFVADDAGRIAGVSFGFNAWGGKYQPCDQDALMARRICEQLGVAVLESPMVAEGGGLCVDGEGTLLTTDSCFPNANRNPGWSRDAIEHELVRTLGVEKVIWLPGDPEDAETDGHVDGIACFARPGAVIIESSADPDDPRRPFFESVREVLAHSSDARGRRFELLELPEAPPEVMRGERYCPSYVNFYLANGAVIAPAYACAEDAVVRERLQSYFPDREIVLVPIDDIAEGGGGIHCITQQQPQPG